METAFYILLVYYAGAVVAYFIAQRNIRKFKTNDNPFSAAILSWLIVMAVIGIYIVKLFKHK